MTKRIFRSVCGAALVVFLFSAVLFMGVLYEYFSGVQRSQLRMQTELAAQGAAHEGPAYFEDMRLESIRVTWIQEDGAIIFDNRSDLAGMENHLEREEIRQALTEGFGESSRYSETLLERAVYCARRLPDGTVLRLSTAQMTPLMLALGMLQPICIIFLAAVFLSMALASRLSRTVVKPLNELNLDDPLHNEGYGEVEPLLSRIANQQRQIRRQEDELHRRQAEFETVTKGMAEGIVLLNEREIILAMNPAAMRLFGADSTHLGKYLRSVNRSIELQALLQKAAGGRHAEMRMELPDGTYQLDASPVQSDGLVSGVVLLMLDVTEKERAERLRREFTANVSHELKTPLQTISGSAELLANGMAAGKDIPAFARNIHAEAQRMIRLVDDIIHLSHLDEGVGDMPWEDVDLYALAEETLHDLTPQAEASGVYISLQGERTVMHGVRRLLQSILFNLCDNAIKYNCTGGSVSVSVGIDGKRALLSVTDTGIGIQPEHQEHIFERFYRVDKSRSKETGGTGLGLSIVKHAVQLHGGEIRLHSQLGEGTTVEVRFPIDFTQT